MNTEQPTKPKRGVAPTKTTPHNLKCRELMKRNYYEDHGREKSCLKYYKKKYIDNDTVMSIINNKELDLIEKLKQVKLFHLNQKISQL